MKNAYLIILLLFIFNELNAQENDSISTDSIFIEDIPVFDYAVLANYMQIADFQKAIEYIDSFQNSERDALFQKALCYKYLNNTKEAIQILSRLNDDYPEDIPVKLELAACFEANINYPKAIAQIDELIFLHPENTYYKIRKAELLYKSEKYRDALTVYSSIDNYDPVYLNRRIAMNFENLNQPDSVKFYYQKVWDIDPQDAYSALSLVKIHNKEENYIEAIRKSEIFLLENPDNVTMKILNAFAYYSLNNYDEAVTRFEACREMGDSSLLVNRSLGISYYMLGNDSLAYPCLTDAYAKDTTNNVVLYLFAKSSVNLEKYPEAIQAYETLLERMKVDRMAYYSYYKGMGEAYEKNSNFVEAVRNYVKAIDSTTDQDLRMPLYFNIAFLCENELNDPDEAIFYYNWYGTCLYGYQADLENKLERGEEVDLALLDEFKTKKEALDEHVKELKEKNKK